MGIGQQNGEGAVAGKRDQLRTTSVFRKPGEDMPTPAEVTSWMAKSSTPVAEQPVSKTFALAPDGSLPFSDNFRLTRVGLVTESIATIEEWQALGGLLRQLEGSIQWLIGDWMAYGERQWGKTYEQVEQETGYAYQTLRDYAYVSKAIDLSIRIDKLSHAHHRLVAALPREQQLHWLEQAAANGWSVAAMKKHMAEEPDSEEEVVYSPLAAKEHKRRFLAVYNAIRAGRTPSREDVEWIRTWVNAIEIE